MSGISRKIKKSYTEEFAKDCLYYDPEQKELKTLLKAGFGKIIADLGCGTGRLAFPLSLVARNVYGIDSDWRMIDYCLNKSKMKNLVFLNQSIEQFLSRKRKIELFIWAWPSYDLNILRMLKKSLGKGKLIVIVNDNTSSFGRLYDSFLRMHCLSLGKARRQKKKFLQMLKNEFFVIRLKTLVVRYHYPSLDEAVENVAWNLRAWYGLKRIQKKRIAKSLKRYQRKDGIVEIGERVFYFMLKRLEE